MVSRGKKLYSILKIRCPQCHEGPFLERKVYDFSAFTKVRKNCTNCGLNYHVEPSFYYGSMYVAYALGVALMVAVITLNVLFFQPFSFRLTFGMVVGAVILFSPLMNALAKIIWANFFFHYNPNKD
jgi:uncharacterized protein (DUF983 family)